MKRGPVPRPLAERFWEKVDRDGPVSREELGRCWIWTAARNVHGYGKIGVPGSVIVGAHRVAWGLERGPIPAGLWVLHRCDNPPCVRIDHLFLGTALDNNRDSASKGRSAAHRHPELYRSFMERCRAIQKALALSKPDPECIHCKGPARIRRGGRCGTCHEYWRRHGVDRGPALVRAVRLSRAVTK